MFTSSVEANNTKARSSLHASGDLSHHASPVKPESEEEGKQSLLLRRLLAIAVFVCCVCLLLASVLLAMNGAANTTSIRSHNECYDDDGLGWAQILMNLDIFLVLDLSFSEVKLIDVSTNLILGQGGRALHAWIAYHVFSDAVTRVMETSPITYDLYISSKFNPTSIESVITYIKTVYYGSFPRHQWLAFWFLWASIYVLAFPTLIGASTGYFSPLTPYYALNNGLLVNSLMVNPSHPTPTLGLDVQEYFRCMNVHNSLSGYFPVGSVTFIGDVWGDLSWNVKSNFSITQSPGCGLLDARKMCIQMGGYNWAISRWMTITVASLELIFVCGIFGVWWDANAHGQLNRRGHRRTGIYRSILDMSQVIVNAVGNIHSLQSDRELKEASTNETIMLDINTTDSHQLEVKLIRGEPIETMEKHSGEVEGWNSSVNDR